MDGVSFSNSHKGAKWASSSPGCKLLIAKLCDGCCWEICWKCYWSGKGKATEWCLVSRKEGRTPSKRSRTRTMWCCASCKRLCSTDGIEPCSQNPIGEQKEARGWVPIPTARLLLIDKTESGTERALLGKLENLNWAAFPIHSSAFDLTRGALILSKSNTVWWHWQDMEK